MGDFCDINVSLLLIEFNAFYWVHTDGYIAS